MAQLVSLLRRILFHTVEIILSWFYFVFQAFITRDSVYKSYRTRTFTSLVLSFFVLFYIIVPVVTEVRTWNGIVINSELCQNVISRNGIRSPKCKNNKFIQDGCLRSKAIYILHKMVPLFWFWHFVFKFILKHALKEKLMVVFSFL